MNDCVDGGSIAKMNSMGECGVVLPTPPPYSHSLMAGAVPPPPYWSHQQQQQQQMAQQNSVANSQQLMEMPPTTSQNIQNFPHQSGFQQPADLLNQPPPFNGMGNNSPAFYQQQQFQEFQKFPCPMNISPRGQFGCPGSNNGIGQMGGGPQQISSPSVTSTADLVQNSSGGGNFLPGNSQMMPPQFGFHHQQPQSFHPPNGFSGMPNNPESEINSTQLGQCDSPMLANRQFAHPGQTSLSSPVPMAGQPRWPIPQMGMPPNGPQFQQQFNQNGNAASSPRFPMLSGGQQMMGPPQMLMPGSIPRRSFLFNTEMANIAASDLQQRQVSNMAEWHLTRLAQWHQQNPSTSRAGFESMQMLQSQQPGGNIVVPANNVGRSPPAPQSRSTKRKASAQTTTSQEQQQSQNQPQMPHNALNSPSNMVPSTPNAFGHPQSVPAASIEVQQQRHSSIDICDSSTNGEIFKRPPSRMPNGGLGMPNCYISPNPGQQPMSNNCFGRMDDENPLKKMEIMTTKTLNEQPATKMARLMGGVEEEQQQQTQNMVADIAKQDKMRKLNEMEKILLQCNSPPIGHSQPMGQGHPQPPQGLVQMHQNGGVFCQLPPAGPPHPSMPMPSFPPDQMPPQFRPSPFFPGQMIPPHAQEGIVGPGGLGQMPLPMAPMTSMAESSSPSAAPFFPFPQRFPQQIRMPNGLIQNPPPPFFGGPAEQNGQIGDFPGSNLWMADGGGPPSQSSMEGAMAMKMLNPQNQPQQQMMTAATNGGGAPMQG